MEKELKECNVSKLYTPHQSKSLLFLSNTPERKYTIIENICTIFSPISNKLIFSKDTQLKEQLAARKITNYTLYPSIDKKMIGDLFNSQISKIEEHIERCHDEYRMLIKMPNKIDTYLQDKSSGYRTLVIMDEFFTRELLQSISYMRNFFQLNRTFGITFVLIQNNPYTFNIPTLRTSLNYIFFYDDFDVDLYKKIYLHSFIKDHISEDQFLKYIHTYHSLVLHQDTRSDKLEDQLLYFS